jgi:hypothetical protein
LMPGCCGRRRRFQRNRHYDKARFNRHGGHQ